MKTFRRLCGSIFERFRKRMLPSSAVHAPCSTSQDHAVTSGSTACRAVKGRSPPATQPVVPHWMCRRQYLRVCVAQLLGYSYLWDPSVAVARVQLPAPFNRGARGGSQAPSPQQGEEPISLQIADVRRLTEHAEAAATTGDFQQVRVFTPSGTTCITGTLSRW